MPPIVHPDDPHVESRKKLDEEIDQMEARLVVLKLARNELVPIMRIHPEILQEIFFLVHDTSDHKGSATLLRLVTWISHKWRELAHNTSSRWSQIDFRNPEWVEVALSRTKNRELEFDLNNSSRRFKYGLEPLIPFTLGNLPRIKKLLIASRHSRNNKLTIPEDTPEWVNPAPRLVDLHLQGLSLPSNLFSGQVPRLTSLSLYSCTIDWEALLAFRHLKRLAISYPLFHATLNFIIEILQLNGPYLEELRLKNVFDSAGVANPSPGIARLEKLEFLKLEDTEPFPIACILDCIELPPHQVDIEIEILEWAESSLVSSLVSARKVEKWPIHHLEIKTEDVHGSLRMLEDWPKTDETTGTFP